MRQKEEKKWINSPGPGAYKDVRDRYYKEIPGAKMGKDERKSFFLQTASSDKPAPSKYKQKSHITANSAPRYGFGTADRERNYFNSFHTLPGPG